jgi:hypothetical protein
VPARLPSKREGDSLRYSATGDGLGISADAHDSNSLARKLDIENVRLEVGRHDLLSWFSNGHGAERKRLPRGHSRSAGQRPAREQQRIHAVDGGPRSDRPAGSHRTVCDCRRGDRSARAPGRGRAEGIAHPEILVAEGVGRRRRGEVGRLLRAHVDLVGIGVQIVEAAIEDRVAEPKVDGRSRLDVDANGEKSSGAIVRRQRHGRRPRRIGG